MTAGSAEELARVAGKIEVQAGQWKEGYVELTTVQYSKARYYGGTIDDQSFENLAKAMDREVEI
jgi:hypothetical protein